MRGILEDLTGKTFNRWTVLFLLGTKATTELKATYYHCRCQCGREKDVPASNLLRGFSKSCGCLRDEKRSKPPGIAARNRLLRGYKNNAKSRDLVWLLTDEQFFSLTKQRCYYCGREPSLSQFAWGSSGKTGVYMYNGVDRKDNKLGYLFDNCVACCFICQRAKMDMEYKEFICYLDRVAAFRQGAEWK